MRARLAGVTKSYGAQVVLEDASLEIGPRARIGLVGPNGVGKSTVLRLLAREEAPDRGVVTLDPPRATVAHLPQEQGAAPGETLGGLLARLTGVAAAEGELEASAAALARDGNTRRESPRPPSDRYDEALARFLALGGGDLETRAAATCASLGLGVELDRPFTALSGGEAARASLAAVLLARADLLLLDEPTNDLDADGLARLEAFLDGFAGAVVVVSHDRAFLDRTVTRVAEVDPRSHAIVEWAGGWSDYARRRDEERARGYARLAEAQARRRQLTSLLSSRRTQARAQGAGLGEKSGGADRRGTNALRTKVRQTERLLERNPLPEKPYEPWELRLELRASGRLPTPVARLSGAVVEQGDFRLGPIDLELLPDERLALTGPNGAGKTTLVRALLGDVELAAGARQLGRGVVPGVIGQTRTAYASEAPLLDAFGARSGLLREDARTLLAKFGLGAAHVGRTCASLSPGERTRAHLAELQARGVNLLVLDEPTNHLDLEAVEQLEAALAAWDGALVVVSHDRRFLEAVGPTRELALGAR
jgi:ATPase subunit of ABC transporter with duplicated ATPase domains